MVSKKEQNLRFQVKKSNDHFAEGLMVFTWALESLTYVLKTIYD